jgi:hypothetical protein
LAQFGLERLGGGLVEGSWLGMGVEDLDLCPWEVPLGAGPVGGDELDEDSAVGVVEADDGADVVAVMRLDGFADRYVPGGVLSPGDHGLQVRRCRAHHRRGPPFDGGGVVGPGFELDQCDGLGQLGDLADVGIVGGGQELGSRAVEAPRQVLVDVEGVVGVDEASVVTVEIPVDVVEFVGGDDQPVLGSTAGELEVAGFSVEPLDPDRDGDVPGPALGLVGGERVAVVHTVGVDVIVR